MLKLNSLVDKVYVINLETATERLEEVSKELVRNNIDYDVIVPIPINNIEIENVNEYLGWNVYAKSLSLTTQKILEDAIDNDYDRIFIFEDDAYIRDELFETSINNFKQLVDKNRLHWDFIHFNYDNCKSLSIEKFYGFNLCLSGSLRCQAYAINKQCFQVYLDLLKTKEMPIDWVTRIIQVDRKRSLLDYTKPVFQKQGEWSTLRNDVVDY